MAVTAELPTRPGTLVELEQQYTDGKPLNAGSMAKVLHTIPDQTQREELRGEISEAQRKYWAEWSDFRSKPASWVSKRFENIVKLLGVREDFAKFLQIQPGTLVVDLMAGSGQMAPYYQEAGRKDGMTGYLGVDNNPITETIANQRLARLGIPHWGFLLQDLAREGLPNAQVGQLAAEAQPSQVQFASMWGLTYLDGEKMTQLVGQCLETQSVTGVETSLAVCMITDGKFDPEVLKNRFKGEIAPREMLQLHFAELFGAIRSIKPMMEFGRTFKDVSPIWYPDEIGDLMIHAGLHVAEVDSTLMWGQSTAMKITA